jgi:hypothetical protein
MIPPSPAYTAGATTACIAPLPVVRDKAVIRTTVPLLL